MKLWELDKSKKYKVGVYTVEYRFCNWQIIGTNRHILNTIDDFQDLEDLEFTEIKPTPEPPKLYAYKNRIGIEGSIVTEFKFFNDVDLDELGGFKRAPEYDITYPTNPRDEEQ